MNYQTLKYNVTVNLSFMAHDAAVELEREGYVKVVTSNKGRKVYFKPTEIDIEPLINIYADDIVKHTAKTFKFDEHNTDTLKNYREATKIVSQYITVDTFKNDIKELQGRIED